MEGAVALVVVVGSWVLVANLLKRRKWGGFKRHSAAAGCALAGLMLVGMVLGEPPSSSEGAVEQDHPGAREGKETASHEAAAERSAQEAKKRAEDIQKKLQKFDRTFVSMEPVEGAEPPKVRVTLKIDAWSEADAVYSFAGHAYRILAHSRKQDWIKDGEDVVFNMRVSVVNTDGDGGRTERDSDVVSILVPNAAVAELLADKSRSTESALLRVSRPASSGRVGKDLLRAFCSSSRYQGASGMAPSATFCSKLL